MASKTQNVRILSLAPSNLRGRTARTPPSAFPFLHITMSKSRWKRSRCHTSEPMMEANPPPGVNDSRNVFPRRPGLAPFLSERIARPHTVPQGAKQPARTVYLGTRPPLVKGRSPPKWIGLNLAWAGNCQATFLPECAATLPINGEAIIRGLSMVGNPLEGDRLPG